MLRSKNTFSSPPPPPSLGPVFILALGSTSFLSTVWLAALVVASGFLLPAEGRSAEESARGKVPPLPPPSGRTVSVSTLEQLERAIQHAEEGDTILVADGHYRAEGLLRIRTNDLTLRGASGDRSAVVLDGTDCQFGELVGLFDCTGVTIADLTLTNARTNALKINADHGNGVHQLTVHNCVFHNIWQRAIKSVRVGQPQQAPREIVIRHCHFANDRPKQFADDPDDKPGPSYDGNYVGGIDAMYARQWTIIDNRFEGIRGRTGSGRAAIFLWVDSRDSVVERNVIRDCDRGIELGNASIPNDLDIHCVNITVRQNGIARAPVGAITATYTRDCRIEQNVINDPENRFRRSIRMVRDNPGLVVVENRIAGGPPRIESDDKTQVALRDNQHGLDPAQLGVPD